MTSWVPWPSERSGSSMDRSRRSRGRRAGSSRRLSSPHGARPRASHPWSAPDAGRVDGAPPDRRTQGASQWGAPSFSASLRDRRQMVLCTGSIAYDYILTFKGRFKDHILLDKTHILNLSFLVDDLQKRKGGVAGNYAYNLALLGYPSAVLATAGNDAAEYRDWLAAHGVHCPGLRLPQRGLSAAGFTTTDMDDKPLTRYYRGANWRGGGVRPPPRPPHTAAAGV